MDKIKVSKEIGEALDLAIKVYGKESLLDVHCGVGCWTIKEYMPLNKLSNLDLAETLIFGYEVEETPEEKILRMYNFNNDFNCAFDRGYQMATKRILETLNIKIKGIND